MKKGNIVAIIVLLVLFSLDLIMVKGWLTNGFVWEEVLGMSIFNSVALFIFWENIIDLFYPNNQ